MGFKYSIGEPVMNTVPLQSDQGTVPARQVGMVDDEHASANKNLYIVRFVNLNGPDQLAPAFEDQLQSPQAAAAAPSSGSSKKSS